MPLHEDDWHPRDSAEHKLKPCDYTSDPDRMRLQDYWQRANPELRLGGVTWGWLKATCRAIVKTREPAWLQAIRQPLEIFTAGQDALVNNDYTRNALPHLKNATLHHLPAG